MPEQQPLLGESREEFERDRFGTAGPTKSTPTHKDGEFKRQHVLFEEIKIRQFDCGHTIAQPNKETLTCTSCGALWLK